MTPTPHSEFPTPLAQVQKEIETYILFGAKEMRAPFTTCAPTENVPEFNLSELVKRGQCFPKIIKYAVVLTHLIPKGKVLYVPAGKLGDYPYIFFEKQCWKKLVIECPGLAESVTETIDFGVSFYLLLSEGFFERAIGIELSADYCAMALKCLEILQPSAFSLQPQP